MLWCCVHEYMVSVDTISSSSSHYNTPNPLCFRTEHALTSLFNWCPKKPQTYPGLAALTNANKGLVLSFANYEFPFLYTLYPVSQKMFLSEQGSHLTKEHFSWTPCTLNIICHFLLGLCNFWQFRQVWHAEKLIKFYSETIISFQMFFFSPIDFKYVRKSTLFSY